MQNKKNVDWRVDLVANNKKAVLFTIDEEVYHQLRYKKRNMSAHVNSLIRQSVFSDENDRRGQTLRDASFRDLVAEAWLMLLYAQKAVDYARA